MEQKERGEGKRRKKEEKERGERKRRKKGEKERGGREERTQGRGTRVKPLGGRVAGRKQHIEGKRQGGEVTGRKIYNTQRL